jgi:hypothetical protein
MDAHEGMTPHYETKEDLDRETRTLKIFCLNMRCTHKKVMEKDDYSPDATFWRYGKRVAVGEVKVRTCASTDWETYMISKAKIDSVFECWHPLPFILIVAWTDRIGWVAVTDASRQQWKVIPGGRVDRGDPRDIEDCYHIPIDSFRRLKME